MSIIPWCNYHDGGVISPSLGKLISFVDDLSTYGTLLDSIELHMRCLSDDPIAPGSEELLMRSLERRRQPTYFRLYRKLKRFEVGYTSSFRHRESKFPVPPADLSKSDSKLVQSEFIEALLLLKKRVKKTDDFDIGRWVNDLERAKENLKWTGL